MPDFMLTGPGGKTYKLTTPDGVTHEDAERELARTMTHQAEQPNPAEPYLKGAKDFARGGVSDVLRGAGVQMPQASNAVGDLLKSDAANTAIGMVNPLKGLFSGGGGGSKVIPTAQASSPNIELELFSKRTRPGSTSYNYNFKIDNKPGNVEMRINDDNPNVANIVDIRTKEVGRNLLGTSSMRNLLSQLRELHPEVDTLRGQRITGARREAGDLSPGYIDVKLPELPAPAATERLPQPPSVQRPDRPINQATLDEMRATPDSAPPLDPRPINPETLREMHEARVNVYHGTNADFEAGELDPAFARNKYEQATFFTDDPAEAKNYGKRVIGASLDPKYGLTVDKQMFDFFAGRGDPVRNALEYARKQYKDHVVFDVPGQQKTYAVLNKDAINPQTLAEMRPNDPLGNGPLAPIDPLSK